MRSTGKGWRSAAAHFQLNPETVKSWWRRGRAADAPRGAPRSPTVTPSREGPRNDGRFPPREPAPSPRAREPLAPAFRRGLQAAVGQRIAFLARPESLHHKGARDVALVVKHLAEAHPEALTLAAQEAATPSSTELADAVAAAFGSIDAAPGLTAIEGGKSATG